MLRRTLALVAYGAIVFVMTVALFALYQRLRTVPHVQFYTVPCENDAKAAWCGSLETIYLAGAILWAAGGAMLLTGVMLGGVVVLRLTPRRWLTFSAVGIASFAGSAALSQSYSTLSDYYYLSLFPSHYPPEFLSERLVTINQLSQMYAGLGIGAIILATAMPILSLVILWSARKLPPQTVALSPAL